MVVQKRVKTRLDFESGQSDVYNMFEAVVDVVHGKKSKKLLFVKCIDCGRFSSFRPKSKVIQFTALYCSSCGSLICFGTQGIDGTSVNVLKFFVKTVKMTAENVKSANSLTNRVD